MIVIKDHHLQVPEYRPEVDSGKVFTGLFRGIFKDEDGQLIIERILPKEWRWNDFSPSENLIEIEREDDGNRFWASTKDIFRITCPNQGSLHLELNNEFIISDYEQVGEYGEPGSYGVHITYKAKLIEFRVRIFRNRHYAQAVFSIIEGTKQNICRTKQKFQPVTS